MGPDAIDNVHVKVEDFGVCDAIMETKKAVYVFKFKFNRSAKAAIRQIHEKGYANAYFRYD